MSIGSDFLFLYGLEIGSRTFYHQVIAPVLSNLYPSCGSTVLGGSLRSLIASSFIFRNWTTAVVRSQQASAGALTSEYKFFSEILLKITEGVKYCIFVTAALS